VKTIPLVAALVFGVRPLASQQQTCLLTPCTETQFIASVNSAIEPLLGETPGKPIVISANLEYAGGYFIPSKDISVLLDYVDGLKAAGVQRIELNPGYLSLSDPAVMAKYDQLVQHIRRLGLMLAINPEYVPAQQPNITTFQQFQAAAAPGAIQIAARYQPDNFVIVHEPDTMTNRMGLHGVQDWDGFIGAVAPLVRQSSPRTRLGAGCYYGVATQPSSDAENAYFEGFAKNPNLDFLTMDVYATTFDQFVTWTQLAHANGKGAYIEETWIPHYFANGLPANWTSESLDQESSVGPASADFASLFPSWIQAMALFASANGMEAVTVFTTPAFFQYGTAGADQPEEGVYAAAAESAIANGQLTPAGQACLKYSQQLGIKVAASLSSASYATLTSVFCGSPTNPNPCNGNADSTVAPDELVSAYGGDLATSIGSAQSANLPTTLAGTSATLVDSSNKSYPVPLFYVSPHQVNYLVPSAAQPGAAVLTFTSADGTKTDGVVLIAVDPGLYTADASGKGAPAAFAVCAGTCAGWPKANGQFVQDLLQPIGIGPSDTVVLELFGTGLRHASAVTATVNGQSVPVEYAGAQSQFTGEDQINVQLPPNLAGSGMVNLVLTAKVSPSALALYDTDTTPPSNTVTIDIK